MYKSFGKSCRTSLHKFNFKVFRLGGLLHFVGGFFYVFARPCSDFDPKSVHALPTLYTLFAKVYTLEKFFCVQITPLLLYTYTNIYIYVHGVHTKITTRMYFFTFLLFFYFLFFEFFCLYIYIHSLERVHRVQNALMQWWWAFSCTQGVCTSVYKSPKACTLFDFCVHICLFLRKKTNCL